MRSTLIILAMLLAPYAAAQATFGGGVGSSGCQDVSRQILRNWFDVQDIMSAGNDSRRPSAKDLHCVSPAYVRDAIPRRAGASGLHCFDVQGKGICCDAQLQECAMR